MGGEHGGDGLTRRNPFLFSRQYVNRRNQVLQLHQEPAKQLNKNGTSSTSSTRAVGGPVDSPGEPGQAIRRFEPVHTTVSAGLGVLMAGRVAGGVDGFTSSTRAVGGSPRTIGPIDDDGQGGHVWDSGQTVCNLACGQIFGKIHRPNHPATVIVATGHFVKRNRPNGSRGRRNFHHTEMSGFGCHLATAGVGENLATILATATWLHGLFRDDTNPAWFSSLAICRNDFPAATIGSILVHT